MCPLAEKEWRRLLTEAIACVCGGGRGGGGTGITSNNEVWEHLFLKWGEGDSSTPPHFPCPLPLVAGKPHNPRMHMFELLHASTESGVAVISHLAEERVSYSISEVNCKASEGKPMQSVCIHKC